MNTLKEELSNIAKAFQGVGFRCPLHLFVVRNGVEMAGQKRPKGFALRPIKQCFQNAAKLCWNNPDLTYYEGFARSADIGIPIHHAWVVHKDAGLVEVTLRHPEKYEYVGVAIPAEILLRQLLRTKVFGLFDIGRGYEVDLMVELDPGLAEILNAPIT